MFRNLFIQVCMLVMIFVAGLWVGRVTNANAAAKNRVFEIRTYTTNDGKLEGLHARFRNHTTKLFQKHGMTNIGYWSPLDPPLSQNTLIYILAYPSREAAKKSWEDFQNDPVWKKAKEESEVNGKLVAKVDSVFMEGTDYSAMK